MCIKEDSRDLKPKSIRSSLNSENLKVNDEKSSKNIVIINSRKIPSNEFSSRLRGSNSPRSKFSLLNPIIQSKLKKGEIAEKKRSIYDVISNFYLIKKFISILQMNTIRKPKFLGESHFNLIDDAAFNFATFKAQNSQLQILHPRKTILELLSFMVIKIFHPFSNFILLWNIIHLMIFCFAFILIPIDISFQIDILQNELDLSEMNKNAIRICIILFYTLDIFVNLNLAYYKSGELIYEREKIIKKYLKKDLYLDLITLTVYIYWAIRYENYVSHIIIFGFFFKFLKIRKIFKSFEELLVINENYFHLFSLFILVIRIVVVTHISACIWHLIGESNSINWMVDKGINTQSWLFQYTYSFYFIIITMNTVGYGDISPHNISEVIFLIFFVIIGCIMFAYSLNCMGAIFEAFYKREKQMKEELFLINGYMRSKNVPQTIQIKIRKYLEHLWNEEQKVNIIDSMKVFNKLSESLKSQLLLEVNGSIVKEIDLFSMNFSQKTLNGLVKTMKEEKYPPGEIIFRAGEHRNRDLFFIKKGNVEIFVENESKEDSDYKILKELKTGCFFGEIEFFSEMARSTGVKSKQYTTLIRFDQSKFKTLIEENDEDKQKFNAIKDRINLYSNYDDLFLKCYSCNQRNHLILDCPLIHRKFFKEIFLSKYNYSVPQTRATYQREHKKHKKWVLNKRISPPLMKKLKSLANMNRIDINAGSQTFEEETDKTVSISEKNESKIKFTRSEENISSKVEEDDDYNQIYTETLKNQDKQKNNKFKTNISDFDILSQGSHKIESQNNLNKTGEQSKESHNKSGYQSKDTNSLTKDSHKISDDSHKNLRRKSTEGNIL